MPTLYIRLLGHFQLIQDGKLIATLKEQRLQALFAYLVLHREKVMTRQQIAKALWPDSMPDQARSNLRTDLSKLRQSFPALDEFLETDKHSLQWRADVTLVIDVAAFEEALQQAEQLKRQGDNAGTLAALQQAVDLYTDALLPKLHEKWVLKLRQRLHDQFLAALETLTTLLQAQQDYAAAIRYAERLLQANPVSEAHHRRLMELHLLQQNFLAALETYKRCREILLHEFKITPSTATEEIHRRIVAAMTGENDPKPPDLNDIGLDELRRLAASWWEDEHRLPFPGVTAFLVRLAILLALHGQYTEALLILDRAFILLAATGEHFWEAELHRWRGKVLQRLGEPVAEVDACFRKALLIARHQQAKFQELCALMSLCLLWWGTEKYHDVAQQLAALYADFQPNSTPEALTALLTLFERFM